MWYTSDTHQLCTSLRSFDKTTGRNQVSEHQRTGQGGDTYVTVHGLLWGHWWLACYHQYQKLGIKTTCGQQSSLLLSRLLLVSPFPLINLWYGILMPYSPGVHTLYWNLCFMQTINHLRFHLVTSVVSESSHGKVKWTFPSRKAYGVCMSLYDKNPVTGKVSGKLCLNHWNNAWSFITNLDQKTNIWFDWLHV